jgi:polyvinyl alcohol dehydrogenase (cytochrome)
LRRIWKTLFTLSLLLVLSLVFFATEASPDEKSDRPFGLPDMESNQGPGADIFRDNCAACHEHSIDRAPPRLVLALMSPSSIVHALIDGSMRNQGSKLSEQERIAVAEYVTHRSISSTSETPEPPRCTDSALKFDFGETPVFPGWGLSTNNARAIPAAVAGLDKHRISELALKWAIAFPSAIRLQSQPALAGGAIYVGSENGNVYSLDRRTGCLRWMFAAAAEARTGMVVSPWIAGGRTGDCRGQRWLAPHLRLKRWKGSLEIRHGAGFPSARRWNGAWRIHGWRSGTTGVQGVGVGLFGIWNDPAHAR